jgi:hypothetical protein
MSTVYAIEVFSLLLLMLHLLVLNEVAHLV